MKTMTLNSLATQRQNAVHGSFSSPNVGGYDRLLRVTLGGVLMADGIHGTGPLGLDAILIVMSIPLIISAIIAWDPFYAMFKVRTVTLQQQMLPHHKQRLRNANGGINIGTVDRITRIVLASVLLATPFLWAGSIALMSIAATGAGILLMMTAIMGWDPIYQWAGIRTATLPIETAPAVSEHDNINHLSLFDPVSGDDEDVYQKAA